MENERGGSVAKNKAASRTGNEGYISPDQDEAGTQYLTFAILAGLSP